MVITVTSGTGTGPTPIAAFDAALRVAGVENYNLISLSSIVPPGAIVKRRHYEAPEDHYGHRLYVVMAEQRVIERNEEAWAGVGWTQERSNGRGLFIEAEGESHEKVHRDIQDGLHDMMAARGYAYGSVESEIAGIRCVDHPVCALVIAVYAAEDWNQLLTPPVL
ncbi:MAG: hypothetical protein NVSMB52_16490 [Chloroflexota bacterium]